ncbi:unnamed protein product [Fasciola hepatica]|uniref:Uncharacterized protein n=1 Tax=Fasciola hepatica TaxID=6192 RepID=A0ABC9HHJ9_FASHE|nr:unnamed protein product [Fasciola hepatica]
MPMELDNKGNFALELAAEMATASLAGRSSASVLGRDLSEAHKEMKLELQRAQLEAKANEVIHKAAVRYREGMHFGATIRLTKDSLQRPQSNVVHEHQNFPDRGAAVKTSFVLVNLTRLVE